MAERVEGIRHILAQGFDLHNVTKEKARGGTSEALFLGDEVVASGIQPEGIDAAKARREEAKQEAKAGDGEEDPIGGEGRIH